MMIAQTPRDPWRAVWRIATGDGLLVALLLATAAGLIATAWLPQRPAADPVTYAHAQWLSEAQARFGEATPTLQALGLFTITRSLGFRALLALLAGCLMARLVENGDRLRQRQKMAIPPGEWHPLTRTRLPAVTENLGRRHYRMLNDPNAAPPLCQADRWPWADLLPLLAHVGALLLLAGLLVTHLWGWRVEGLTVQGGERVTLRGDKNWIALDKDGLGTTHSSGVVTIIERHIAGVEIAALDSAGNPLSLQQTLEADSVTRLAVALTEDQYLAIPEAQVVVRLAAQSNHADAPLSPVLVQIYRSPSGQLITEATVDVDMKLVKDEVTLEIAKVPYAQVTVTFNPGLWPSGAGIALLVAGLVGSVVWPPRRFWLRENEGKVEGTGDIPATLSMSEEG